MSKNNENKLVPKLRFPEFENDGEWKEKKFDDLCKFVRGPFGGALKKEIFVNEGYAVYEQQHAIYNDFTSFRYFISQEKYNELKRFSVLPKDIIMSCSGTMGKFAVIPENPKEGIINQALLKLTVKPDYEIGFIKTSLELPVTQNKLLSQSAGGAIKNVVEVAQIKEINLLIPERKEQQKIAACLSSLDEVITAESQKLALLKDHKKGLLQNLLPQAGETVPKFRFKEFENSGEWEIRSVGDNIDLISGIAIKSEDLSDDKSGTPILRGINITEGEVRHSYEMDKFYLGAVKTFEKYLVEENDIVIAMDGSKVGKNVAMISSNDAGAILIQRVARIRAINSDIKYLYQHFLSNNFRNYVDVVNTSSGIPHISAKQIRDFEIGFPPKIEEQQKIASTLSSIDDLIIAQNQKLEALQLHKKGLLQGLFPSVNDGDNGKI